ncbi:hypothetical protein Rt10032_c07g3184 [Rhodotorula toruloides]|uniref:Uncharacterized protein n=1 Tax=Rhodotorula toruloides TaxID=5286 RepID=A0A511KFM3_RHOTO|nr:hypothetical protein Rt10032_c07g3184 [Rhodotorula toruloides]
MCRLAASDKIAQDASKAISPPGQPNMKSSLALNERSTGWTSATGSTTVFPLSVSTSSQVPNPVELLQDRLRANNDNALARPPPKCVRQTMYRFNEGFSNAVRANMKVPDVF